METRIIPKRIHNIIYTNNEISSESEEYKQTLVKTLNYVVVKDKLHNDMSFHYTAWCLHPYYSLLHLKKSDLSAIKKLINIVKILLPEEPLIFIHFPPNYWRLHIHFVQKNHIFKANKDEIHFINDVIKNIELDEFYYLKRVGIKSNI